jgi:hypothetical protein
VLQKSLPFILLSAPKVIAELAITVPFKETLAQVVKLSGTHVISQADAPLSNKTSIDAAEVNAPTDLKI